MKTDKISTYLGKPIEQMTREELIDALNFFASQLTAEREEHARRLDVLTGRAAQQAQADTKVCNQIFHQLMKLQGKNFCSECGVRL